MNEMENNQESSEKFDPKDWKELKDAYRSVESGGPHIGSIYNYVLYLEKSGGVKNISDEGLETLRAIESNVPEEERDEDYEKLYLALQIIKMQNNDISLFRPEAVLEWENWVSNELKKDTERLKEFYNEETIKRLNEIFYSSSDDGHMDGPIIENKD